MRIAMNVRTRLRLPAVGMLTLIMLFPLASKTITLEQCEESALLNHPLTDQLHWIEMIEDSGLRLANAQYLPKVSLAAKATRQSEVTSVSIPAAGITLDGSLNQFQLVGEVNQIVLDGGAVKAQKEAVVASSAISRAQFAVQMDSVKRAVRQAYFSVILLDRKLDQLRIMQKVLADTRAKVTAYLNNGIATRSDVDALRVEEINMKSSILELETEREKTLYTLERMTGMAFGDDVNLGIPEMPEGPVSEDVSRLRHEFSIYRGQLASLEAQQKALHASLYPKIQVFAQGGYTQPGLNMLNPDPSAWWLVGIRGSLALDAYYTYQAHTQTIESRMEQVGMQVNQFTLEEEIRLHRQLKDIERLKETIELDKELIALKVSIQKTDEAKIETGSLSVSDLIEEMNEVTLAEMKKAEHEVQLLLAQSELDLIAGNGE